MPNTLSWNRDQAKRRRSGQFGSPAPGQEAGEYVCWDENEAATLGYDDPDLYSSASAPDGRCLEYCRTNTLERAARLAAESIARKERRNGQILSGAMRSEKDWFVGAVVTGLVAACPVSWGATCVVAGGVVVGGTTNVVVAETGDYLRGDGFDINAQEARGDFLIGAASGAGTGAIARAAGPLAGRTTVGSVGLFRFSLGLSARELGQLGAAYVKTVALYWILKILGTGAVEDFVENEAEGS